MPFTLRKPNGSPAELPGEKIHLYQQARDVATAMGKIQFLRPAVLAQIIADFGEHGLHCVERWCARPMTSIDTLQNMCEGKEPLVFEKPSNTAPKVNETPGKERRFESSEKTVWTKWHWSQQKAIDWLMRRGYSMESLQDYFDQAGVDQNQNFVYQLKKEYQ